MNANPQSSAQDWANEIDDIKIAIQDIVGRLAYLQKRMQAAPEQPAQKPAPQPEPAKAPPVKELTIKEKLEAIRAAKEAAPTASFEELRAIVAQKLQEQATASPEPAKPGINWAAAIAAPGIEIIHEGKFEPKAKELHVDPIPEPQPEIVINEEWQTILANLNDENRHDPLFITGNAGTGKTTLMHYFVEHAHRNIAVVAPTGVAALRAEGVTIHSLFSLPIGVVNKDELEPLHEKKRSKLLHLDALVIDEVSMVRADVMDAIVRRLEVYGPKPGQPFGGVRLIMFGDLLQLPPVVKGKESEKFLIREYGTDTPFFFHSTAMREHPAERIELKTTFRQKDPQFVSALNAAREGEITPELLAILNARVDQTFKPTESEGWISLTTTNDSAERANKTIMDALNTESRTFYGQLDGDFKNDRLPTEEILVLKVGAPVMFVRNDIDHKWVNGTLGKVISVKPDLMVECPSGVWEVESEVWEAIDYEYDEKEHRLIKHVIGSFRQIPLKIAAAITIHKSQGLTFDKAIIDLGNHAFAAGQTYVGLSRCTSLTGLVLRRAIRTDDLIVSKEAVRWLKGEAIAAAKPREAQQELF